MNRDECLAMADRILTLVNLQPSTNRDDLADRILTLVNSRPSTPTTKRKSPTPTGEPAIKELLTSISVVACKKKAPPRYRQSRAGGSAIKAVVRKAWWSY
jgi:hypothetical protein